MQRFTFALIRGGKYFHSHGVTYPNPTLFKTEGIDDTWLAKRMRDAYNRELRYAFFIPMRRISFATYIRVLSSTNTKGLFAKGVNR
jgi:hypothetical protein